MKAVSRARPPRGPRHEFDPRNAHVDTQFRGLLLRFAPSDNSAWTFFMIRATSSCGQRDPFLRFRRAWDRGPA